MDSIEQFSAGNNQGRSYIATMTNQYGNTFTVPILAPKDQEALAIDLARKQMDFQFAECRRQMESFYCRQEEERKLADKQKLEEQKSKAKIRQMEVYDELRTRRELIQIAVIQDGSGRFKVEYNYPDGSAKYSCPILSVEHMRLTIIKDIESSRSVELVEWDRCGDKAFLLKEGNSSEFAARLHKAGLAVGLRRELRKMATELVYSWLRKNATVYYPSAHFGWVQEKGRWHFVDDDEMTFDDYWKGRTAANG